MATTRGTRAPYLLLGVLVFVVVSQVVDLAVGAPEVGVRVAVMVAAAVGAVATGVRIVRLRRVVPPPPRSLTPAPEDPGAAGATSARG
ncbi:hypothetical protein [Cellulomonas sp. ICMP 17802]|uniref:hypothetical protein n=1 Tax=Cellulomonas sp. ICMP 17802 TaxID=3239199 RepID=UPI00351BE53E